LRLLGMIFASLTMLCLLCAPALAQSSPSADQYQGGSGYCPPGSTCIQSLADGADDFSENAEQGTDAVNDAMGAVSASAVSGDASASPASSAGSPAANEEGVPGGITKLPETGGASLAALGSGILLAASGLVARRIAR